MRKLLKFPTFSPRRKGNPLPDVDQIRKVYAGNRSTKAFNIWCDSVSKLGIYMQNRDGAFSPKKFRSPLAPKLLIGLKKSRGCKNGTNILYLHAKFGGDPPLHGGVRNKSLVGFFFVCHALDLEQRFSHLNSDIVAICRSILMRISALFRGRNALSNL